MKESIKNILAITMITTVILTNVIVAEAESSQDITADFTDRAFLVRLYEILDKNASEPIYLSDVNKMTYLDVSSQGISNIDGIEHFVALEELRIYENSIISFDVSKNLALKSLACGTNPLISLDVSKNANLEFLGCNATQLTELDISNNFALDTLALKDVKLTNLDLSNNRSLTYLYAPGTLLTTVDFSNNPLLERVDCFRGQIERMDFSKNPALRIVDLSENKLTSLDFSGNPALIDLRCSGNNMRRSDITGLAGDWRNLSGNGYLWLKREDIPFEPASAVNKDLNKNINPPTGISADKLINQAVIVSVCFVAVCFARKKTRKGQS